MRKVLVTLMCSVLFAGGCASKEMAKKAEEPVASSATATAPKTETPAIVESAPANPTPAAPSASGTVPKAEAPSVQPETPSREAQVRPESQGQGEKKAALLQEELQKIYFEFDSSALSQTSREVLGKTADYLLRNSSVKVRIEGNCDERGSDEYNLALGERRAKAAQEYLVTLGVAADRIGTISYGLEKPADSGHTEEAWAKNRRDEFVVIK